MNEQPTHFTELAISKMLTERVAALNRELQRMRECGECEIDIAAFDLLALEALGYTVDMSTGLVSREVSGE